MPKHIVLMPVESSQIHAVGHDPETNTLAIQFKSKTGPGSVYHYQNISADKYTALVSADSIGKHFGAHIKPHTTIHPFKKIS